MTIRNLLDQVIPITVGIVMVTFGYSVSSFSQPSTGRQSADENSKITGFAKPSALLAEEAENRKDIQESGYINKADQISRAEYVEDRMAERKEWAKLTGLSLDVSNDKKAKTVGFYKISGKDYIDDSTLPFRPSIAPNKYLTNRSESYLLFGGQKLKQLHKNTVFGSLIIDESINTSMTLESPNITIAGKPATFVHVKYKDKKWGSVIYAPNGSRLFVVEAAQKLNGERKSQLIQLVDELVVKANSIN